MSDCDNVDPYYTSSGPFKAKTMLPCGLDALRKFHCHGFDVCALVCDGASSNLTMIKTLLGRRVTLSCKRICLTHMKSRYTSNIFFQMEKYTSWFAHLIRYASNNNMREFHIRCHKSQNLGPLHQITPTWCITQMSSFKVSNTAGYIVY